MRPCRACHATEIRASHRQNWLERGPLTWCGILPYRCGRCHKRFYRVGWRDPRRWHPRVEDPAVEESRAPRWPFHANVTVVPTTADGALPALSGRTENLSVRGVRIRLSTALPVDAAVELSMQGRPSCTGRVCWVRSSGTADFVHGVEFTVPLQRGTMPSAAIRVLRRQRARRRALIALLALAAIGAATGTVAWLMDAARVYGPRYYEPKDVERERYEMQRRDASIARPSAERR